VIADQNEPLGVHERRQASRLRNLRGFVDDADVEHGTFLAGYHEEGMGKHGQASAPDNSL